MFLEWIYPNVNHCGHSRELMTNTCESLVKKIKEAIWGEFCGNSLGKKKEQRLLFPEVNHKCYLLSGTSLQKGCAFSEGLLGQ